jgi:hypothetical protein
MSLTHGASELSCMPGFGNDFETEVLPGEDREVPSTVTVKWCVEFHEAKIWHSPLDVVAWPGHCAPCKYDLKTYCQVGAGLFEHPDLAIFTVLTASSGVEGTANIDFVLFRDIVNSVSDQNVMFTGDIVEALSACYFDDCHFKDWGKSLDNIKAFNLDAIAPGRGDAVVGNIAVNTALERTRDFVNSTYKPVWKVAVRGGSLKDSWDAKRTACDPKFKDYAINEHCLPFNVSRAYDESLGIDTPSNWTAERDMATWEALQR